MRLNVNSIGCLYKLTFKNGKCYIGITQSGIEKRVGQHIRKCGNSSLISNAIKKYGVESFTKEVLVTGKIGYLAEIEIKAIQAYGSLVPNGYNVALGGQLSPTLSPFVAAKVSKTKTGMKAPWLVGELNPSKRKEVKDKISLANTGRKFPQFCGENNVSKRPEVRVKILASVIGRKHTEETKAKLSVMRMGKKLSQETKEKIIKKLTGRPVSEASRAKSSASNSGQKRSEETRKKISEKAKGKVIAAETRLKMSISHRGQKHSQETIEKCSASRRLYWAKKRGELINEI